MEGFDAVVRGWFGIRWFGVHSDVMERNYREAQEPAAFEREHSKL